MEDQVKHLVYKTQERFSITHPRQRLLIGISGIPGSGKSTLANTVVRHLNALNVSPIAIAVPMDGYHLSRAQLSALPNPEEAHRRRGAAFTFDGEAFLALVRRVRELVTAQAPTILAPSFDHAIKDPVADDIAIPSLARIVVFEGNYLSLNQGSWKEAAALMDELWFVEVDLETAVQRLAGRHVKAGIVGSLAEGERRARDIDMVNGKEIMEGRVEVDEIVVSRDDNEWKPDGWGG